jgi:hypothetical protein
MATKRQRRKRRRRQQADDGTAAGTGTNRPPAVVLDDQQRAKTAARRAGNIERPPPLWGSFPLTEIVIFIGLIVFVVGLFIGPPQGFVMIVVGLGLASLAGLELSIREHFSAFRSHTLLLSAVIAVPLFGVLFLGTTTPTAICVAVALVAFGGAAWLFASAFRRRSGGALYRLR